MRRVRGWIAVLLLAAVFASACGGDDDNNNAVTNTTTAGTATNATTVNAVNYDREATLKAIISFLTSRLDPHFTLNGVHMMIYDRLLQIDPDKQIKPGVASAWKLSDDALTLTLTLRSDAKFNDGTPIDGAAVKANLDRARGNPTTLPFAAAAYAAVTSVTAVNATTVEVKLSKPDATLLYQMASNFGAMINPKAIAANTKLDLGDEGAGSTGYRVANYEGGKSLVLERVATAAPYWDKTAFTPKRIELTVSRDAQAQTSALTTGAVDIAYLDMKSAQAKTSLGTKFAIQDFKSDGGNILLLYPTGPLADVKVRKAVAQAIDFGKLVSSGALPVDAEPITQLFPPGSPGYVESNKPLAYDLEAAKKVLTTPFEFRLAIPAGVASQQLVGEYVKEQLARVGVTVNLTPMPLADILSKGAAGELGSSVQAFGGVADPTGQIGVVYASNQKAAGAQAPEVLADIAAANLLKLGSPERKTALENLNKKWLETSTVVPIERDIQHFGYRDKVVGMDLTPHGYSGLVDMRYWGLRAS